MTVNDVAAAPKRVLIVHSFGSAAPPFTTTSIAFETELTEKMGERLDLDEVSLDMARYADRDMQDALVDYIEKRQAKWQPDLVVPIGSPAGIFVAQYRDRLFPNAPILYCSMDRRRLPPGALDKNATFLGESFDLPGLAEDMLQVVPATTNIAVVIGASAVEQYWADAFRHEWEPFTNRVNLTWLNNLSLDQMLDRVSKLPPHSFVFLILLLRDATGVTHNADEALKRIHAVANAPVNSIFQNQLGLGIVGGRLYQAELEGQESAHVAIRILHGEPASGFPPKVIGPLQPRYDWRELQRWKIGEERLPAGATVLFRAPTVWERHRAWIILGVTVCVAQALLSFGLVANLVNRRRIERSLAEMENRFRVAADAAPVMIWMSGVDKLCTFFNRPWLDFTGRTLQQEMGDGWADGVHRDDLGRCLKTYIEAFDAREPFVMEYRLRRKDGEYRWISDAGKARHDSHGNFIGYIGSCLDVTDSRRKTEALTESESRLRAILDTAVEGIITIDESGIIESTNAAAEKIFGYTAAELKGKNVNALMPAPFGGKHDRCLDNFRRSRESGLNGVGCEVSGRRKDGSVFPLDLAVREILLTNRSVFAGFVRDITERKLAERAAREFGARLLQAQETERARLARELHDDITQRLARLAIDAGRLDTPLAGGKGTIGEFRAELASVSEDIHALSYRLHPSMVGDLGLAAALRAECERFSRESSISTDVKLAELPSVIPENAALGIFRVAQEALRNVSRHSRSRLATVSLRPFDHGLQLAVADTGVGFDPGAQRRLPSLGLASMKERVRLLGGELDIESAPGSGTTILAWVPLNGSIT